jgi:hypothetical protein
MEFFLSRRLSRVAQLLLSHCTDVWDKPSRLNSQHVL